MQWRPDFRFGLREDADVRRYLATAYQFSDEQIEEVLSSRDPNDLCLAKIPSGRRIEAGLASAVSGSVMPEPVGAQWELPGAVAPTDKDPRHKTGFLASKAVHSRGQHRRTVRRRKRVLDGEVLVCTRQRTLQFPLRPYTPRQKA